VGELTQDGSDDEVRAMTLNIKGSLSALRSAAREVAFDEAITVARRLGNLSLEAMALGNMIQTRLRGDGIDEPTVSKAQYQLTLHRKLGDRQGEGLGQYRYGQVLLRRELFTEAISAFLRSLELLEPGEHDYVRAVGHVRLSTTYARAGNRRLAFHHADVGMALSEKVGHEYLRALALEALGDALFLADRPQEPWPAGSRPWRCSGARATKVTPPACPRASQSTPPGTRAPDAGFREPRPGRAAGRGSVACVPRVPYGALRVS
jgi:tetratricopeptide (TPR) repeat protein